MMNKHHKGKRTKFFDKYPEFWADMYEQEYAVFDVKEVETSFTTETQEFTAKAGQIFFKIYDLLSSEHVSDETLIELGFPEDTLRFVRLKTTNSKTIIGRFDSVIVDGVHKLMEFNSDTPTFIYELFKMNGEVTEEFGYLNPNKNESLNLGSAVKNAIFESYATLGTKHFPNIVFTSHEENKEDTNTVKYLRQICGLPSQYIPLEKLRIIEGNSLIDVNGNKIDVLYRQTFATENLILDIDPKSGEKVGVQLLDLVEKKKIVVVNPPSAFLLQSKAVMAVIWGLHEEQSPFFTSEEHDWIQKYFLPTYLEPDRFIENGEKYVKKPVFGREGDTVEIVDPNGKVIMEDKNKSYTDYLSVYQKYVELPTTTFQTVEGEKVGHIMVGSFLINGEPSAYGFRVGNQITDNLSYFLPVGIKQND